MVWLRSIPKSSNHWLASPHTISIAPKTLWNRSTTSLWHKGNVSALMMCLPCSPLPVDPALNIIKDLLEKDHTLKERTVLAVSDIILLLEFCLKNTYFSFKDQFYEQVEGVAMGSPVSLIVTNLYMEYLEQKALSTAPHLPRFWHRFCDDTFVNHKEVNKQSFFLHINSVDPAIQFTVENNKEGGSIPFLDAIVKPEADGTLSITVYRKPTHTDQYLQWDSHHQLSAKIPIGPNSVQQV